MSREEFEYAIKSCECFIYRGQTYYEESELIKTFEDMGLIEQEVSNGDIVKAFQIGLAFGFAKKYDEMDKIMEGVKKAATSKPKTGHWIKVSDGYGDNAYICECSECKDTVWVYKDANRKWNFCPNCGAKMVEEQESEKISCKATKCENCKNHNYCDYEPQERSEE